MLVHDKKGIKSYCAAITFGVAVLLAIVVTQIMSVCSNGIVNIFNSYFSLPVFVEAVSLFIIFRELKINWDKHRQIKKGVTYISGTSLGIYLLHPFVMEHLDSIIGINAKMCHPVLSLPAVTILSFVISGVVIGIMRKISVVREVC